MTKNLERYLLINANEDNSVSELDTLDFCIETSENFEIGNKLSFSDFGEERRIENFIINHKEIEFRNNALTFTYKISTEKGFYVQQIYNEQITGLSLMGKVMDRVQDTVIVDFEIDKNDTFDLSKG